MEPSMARPRALVAAASFALRNTMAATLEDDGWLVLEASSVDEVLWCLITSRMSEHGAGIDLVVADAGIGGLRALFDELGSWPRQPGVVLVGVGGDDAAPEGVARARHARDVDALRTAVDQALEAVRA